MHCGVPRAVHAPWTFNQFFQFGPAICTDVGQRWLLSDTSKKICLPRQRDTSGHLASVTTGAPAIH